MPRTENDLIKEVITNKGSCPALLSFKDKICYREKKKCPFSDDCANIESSNCAMHEWDQRLVEIAREKLTFNICKGLGD